jgi:hypothetical protein
MYLRNSIRRTQACRPLLALFALPIVAALAGPSPCHAGLIISAPDIVATAGTIGSFNIIIQDTDPIGSAPYNVASDVIQVSLSGLSDVTFTAATIDTTTANIGLPTTSYIFTQTSTSPGSPLSFDNFPNTSFTASDAQLALNGYQAINSGDTYGLVHVSYTIDSSAITSPELGTIAISPYGANSSLSDASGNSIPFSVMDGTFTVVPMAMVPEPASIISMLIGGACVGAYAWRRRKA